MEFFPVVSLMALDIDTTRLVTSPARSDFEVQPKVLQNDPRRQRNATQQGTQPVVPNRGDVGKAEVKKNQVQGNNVHSVHNKRNHHTNAIKGLIPVRCAKRVVRPLVCFRFLSSPSSSSPSSS